MSGRLEATKKISGLVSVYMYTSELPVSLLVCPGKETMLGEDPACRANSEKLYHATDWGLSKPGHSGAEQRGQTCLHNESKIRGHSFLHKELLLSTMQGRQR